MCLHFLKSVNFGGGEVASFTYSLVVCKTALVILSFKSSFDCDAMNYGGK